MLAEVKIRGFAILLVVALSCFALVHSPEAKPAFFFESDLNIENYQDAVGFFSVAQKTTDYQIDYESGFISGGATNLLGGGSGRTPILSLNLLPRYQLRSLPVSGNENQVSTLTTSPTLPKIRQPTVSKEELFISGRKSFGFSYSPSGEAGFQQSLALALKGKLSEKVGFAANLSDRNLPSGSGSFSKRIDQFDQLGLAFDFPQGSLSLGDVFFKSNSGNLLNFERKISGLGFAFNDSRESLGVAFGSGPGEFRTVELSGQEGKQGPYSIASSRIFIIPGSEKVYLDGELLTSGREADYEMDSERGALTFSPRHPISNFSRIRLEYEFQSGPYAKNISAARSATGLFNNKFKFRAGYLGSKDKLDSPLMKSLSSEERERLASTGADSSEAVRDGAVFVGAGKGDYSAFLDSTGNRQYRYVGSSKGDYSVSFSLARGGPGDYRYLGGGIYEFVGTGRGSYLPILYLPVPTSQTGANLGIEFAPTNLATFLELSLGETNRNLFSSQGGVKSSGTAFLGGISWQNSDEQSLKVEAKFRGREADYQFLGNKDESDFAYRWNLSLSEERLGQTQGVVSMTSKWSWGQSWLNLGGLSLSNQKQRGLGESEFLLSPLTWLAFKTETQVGGSGSRSGFYRTKNSVTLRWGNLALSSAIERERAYPYLGSNFEIRQSLGQRLEYKTYFLEASLGNRDGYGNSINSAGTSSRNWGRLSRFNAIRLGSKPVSWKGKFTSEGNLGWRQTTLESKKINRLYLFLKQSYQEGGWRVNYSQELMPIQSPNEIYSYLDVGRGNGNYRYENGGYVSDPYGNFTLVSEAAGETLAVSRTRQNWEVVWEPYRNFASTPTFWSQVSYRALFSFDGNFSKTMGAVNIFPVFGIKNSRRHELEFRQTASYLPISRKLRIDFSWTEKSSKRSYSAFSASLPLSSTGTLRSERRVELNSSLYGQKITQNYSLGYLKKNSGSDFWLPYQIQGGDIKCEWLYSFNRTVTTSCGGRFYQDKERISGKQARLVSASPKLIISLPEKGRAEAGISVASVSGNPVSFEQAEGNLKGLNWDYNLTFDYRLGSKVSASLSYVASQRPVLGKSQRANTHLSYLF